jgi:tRNA-modifying protein YgfZ
MSLAADYASLRERAGIGSIGSRRQIAVAGGERASYLQGLLTNDIQGLVAGSGCYSAWLTPHGRMLTDMHVLESGDLMLLDLPADQAGPALERLDQFLFGEDVQLALLDDGLTGVWLHGPAADAMLMKVFSGLDGISAWPSYRSVKTSLQGEPVVVARIDQLGVPGFVVYLSPTLAPPLEAALREAGAAPVGQEAIEVLRIEARYPLFGVDMTDDTIPLEAGIEARAISFSKGCYVGQEVIIRVLHRGHGRVARRLVGLQVEGAPPAAGDRVFAADREIGFVTSAAESPRLGAIALGYLHRDFVDPGTTVRVRSNSSDAAATVTDRAS